MGYTYRVGGVLRFEPALTEDQMEVVCKEFGSLWFVLGPNHAPLEAVGVETEHNEVGHLDELAAEVQSIVDLLPGHTFTGGFEIDGEFNGALWRMKVVDRAVLTYKAEIVWPAGSELS